MIGPYSKVTMSIRKLPLIILLLAGPAVGADADMTVRDCLSTEGARQSDTGSTGGLDSKRRCVFIYATACARNARDAQSAMQCHDAEAKAWDGLLNESYARLKALSSSRLFAALQTFQRAWPAYRDAMCKRFYETEEGVTGLSQSAERACLVRETALRALALQEVADNVSATEGYRR